MVAAEEVRNALIVLSTVLGAGALVYWREKRIRRAQIDQRVTAILRAQGLRPAGDGRFID